MRYVKHSLKVLVFFGACLAMYIAFFSTPLQHVFAQEGVDFWITQILRNDVNPSVVAFTLYGSFKNEDVVNMYSNDVFIKAKAINTPELVGKKEITIDNISVDVFQTGDNLIVAKLERSGTEVMRTPAFRLTVQEPPIAPTVEVLLSKEEDLIGLNITGIFQENDVIQVFLNDIENRTKTLSFDESDQKTISIVGIPIDELQIGENFFTVSIRRGERESDRSKKSDPVVIEEPEKKVVELLQCAKYDEPKKLLAQHENTHDGFGSALDVKDGVFVISTRDEKTYIYTKSNKSGDWINSATLLEQDFKKSGSAKKSIAIYDDTTILIADPSSGYRAQSAGAVHIYRRFSNAWITQSAIAPSDLKEYEYFGSSIEISGQTLVVGAKQQDNSGAVYIYTNIHGVWGNPFRIVPEDTAPNQKFGYRISANNKRIAVGAPNDGVGKNGAVYVYTKEANTWHVEKIIQQNQRLNARFGTEVFLLDDMLFVGALRNDQGKGTLNSGVVYVYARQNGLWQVTQKLTPKKDAVGGEFGSVITRAGNMLAIGAPKSNIGRKKGGAVYLYKQKIEGAQWTLAGTVSPTDLRTGDRFGADIAFDGLNLLIGAYGNDSSKKNIGAVYEYTAETITCVSDGTKTIEKATATSEKTEEKQTSGDLLEILKKQKEILDTLVVNASSIASKLGERIQGVYDGISKKQENIVIYDESKVLANAQRRAAERRGIIGPGLPNEVMIHRVDSAEKVPKPPTEETVRTRNVVVQETKNSIGIVVPVTNKDLHLGDVHEDVYRLQVFLNENGYIVARKGAGSPGNETSAFNTATDQALRTFQLVEGLPITGVFDKRTRDNILTRLTTF